MAAPNDFLTLESLFTFAGATTATVVIPNALQRALNFNPRWLALAVALLVCFALVFHGHSNEPPGASTPTTDYLIAFVNGCLVFCSAAGATDIGATAANPGGPQGMRAGDKRSFFSPWY